MATQMQMQIQLSGPGPTDPSPSRNAAHLADIETADLLSTDEFAIIFGFIAHVDVDIMRARARV